MIRRSRRGTWWALIVGGVAGAIIATLVLIFTTGGPSGGVQSASAHRPAASTAAGADQPSVVFIGDSWTEGSGTTALRGYAVRTAEQLRWNYLVLGVGGSGYDVAGRGSTFGQRIDRAVSVHPDVIVVQGSLNERNSTAQSLRPAAIETLARLRSEADPATTIVVMGASYTPGTPKATIDWINDAVRAAAAQSSLPFIDVAAEDWTDPQQRGIWADPNHPNDVGAQVIADRLVPLLRAQLAP